jgi:hypothetical protein
MALAGGVGLYGIYRMSQPDPNPDGPSRYISNSFGGFLILLGAGLYASLSMTELIPFGTEGGMASRLHLQPLVSVESKTLGLQMQVQL